MSTLQVANLAFESTDNNQITYNANTINLIVGGASNVFFTNATSTTIKFIGTVFSGNNISISNATYTSTSNVDAKILTTNGQIIYSGNVSPALLTTNVADWDPQFGNSYFIRVSSNAAVTISGMVEGTNGQIVVLNNIGNNAITLAAEDAVNENTATRRFNLPDNVGLYPFSSISLIYDGLLARWRAQNSLGTPLFHKQTLTKGFFSGGQTVVSPSTIATTSDRTTYSTEITAAIAGANLSQARYGVGSFGNADKGFFLSGATSPITQVATTDRTTFAAETTAAISAANVSTARSQGGSAGNSCKGFYIGGATPAGGSLTTADRTTYSTETTAAVPGANLSQSRQQVYAVGNVCKGFFIGGNFPAALATADRTTYSTETTAAVPGANLSQARGGMGTAGNACKGFFNGGRTPTAVATSDRTTYATEVTAAISGANLSAARSGLGGAGNTCKGFFNGGGCSPIVATSDRTTYSTETTAAVPGANLSQARQLVGGI